MVPDSTNSTAVTACLGIVTTLLILYLCGIFKSRYLRATLLTEKRSSALEYIRSFKPLVPYLLPRSNFKIRFCLATCLVCLVVEGVLNVLLPRQIGIVANELSAGYVPYKPLLTYMVLYLLNGESGVGLAMSLAKVSIRQFCHRQITTAAFGHAMSLSVGYHSNTSPAEVMKAVEQGDSLVSAVEVAVLEVLPTIVNLCVALIVLCVKFGGAVSLYMATASVVFVFLEAVTSSWNLDNRRTVAEMRKLEARTMHEAIQGWQTVSMFNTFAFERKRFADAVDAHLHAKGTWARLDALIKGFRQGLIPIMFVAPACLSIRRGLPPGEFMFLVQYWEYLIWPIKLLAHAYRQLLAQLADGEQLLQLLELLPVVRDRHDATHMGPVRGHVKFDNVFFSYNPEDTVLQEICLDVKPGATVAIVGATGSGKSTILKLVMRFHDVTSGSITVDGVDIRNVTQASLRENLSVVPQHPQLFNTSILENVRYAKRTASDEDVFEACRAAAIHDRVLAFPDGYETNVGQNGLKLSGGEIQRLAIARAFLRDSRILILDEATSAVDTATEAEIQKALTRLCQDRTTFIVAHRLSTIIGADVILVLDKGVIVERGSHQELLGRGSRYSEMWRQVPTG